MNANSDKDYIDAKVETTRAIIDGFRAEIGEKFDGFRAEFTARLEALRNELLAEMHKNTAQIIKWMVGLFIAFSATFITVIAFVLNNAIPKAPVAAPQPVAPVIIQMPPWPTAPPAK